MLKKILLVVVIAAATAYGLWHFGFIDKGRVKDEVGDLRDRAEKDARRVADDAAKKVRDAAPGK
jgi:hypothetical protein